MNALPVVAVPSQLPVLTVLVHPDQDPAAPDSLRVMRSTRRVAPWVPITGRGLESEQPRMHNGVVGWRLQHYASILAELNGRVR